MNGRERWTVSGLAWRAFLFAVLARLFLGLEQLVEVWLLPTTSAQMGVRQLEPSDTAAESLRLYEWVRSSLPIVNTAALVTIGLVLFVPGMARRARRLLHTQI